MSALAAIDHLIRGLISKRRSPSPFDQMRGKQFYLCGRQLRLPFLLWCALCVFPFPVNSQILQEETLSGPDSHETGQGPHGHLFGTWGGERTHLLAWRAIRFSVHQRFPLEPQERAERAICELEPIPGNGRYRFWHADGPEGAVFPCDCALASRRQSRSVSRSIDQSQWDVQREYMSTRFMVDREAMAG